MAYNKNEKQIDLSFNILKEDIIYTISKKFLLDLSNSFQSIITLFNKI